MTEEIMSINMLQDIVDHKWMKNKILDIISMKIMKSDTVAGYISTRDGKIAEVRVIVDCNAKMWRGKQPPDRDKWVDI